MKIDTAMVKDGVVIGLSIAEKAGLDALEAALVSCGDCDHLIPVDSNVRVGDTFDDVRSVFLRDGERIFPAKTDSEEIADLKNQLQNAITEVADLKIQIGEMQDALVEVGDIITMSLDGAEGGVADG